MEEKEPLSVESIYIKHILIISSSYHYFQLEEEGRLNTLLSERHSYNLSNKPPEITHLETGKECIEFLKTNKIDFIIIFDKLEDIDILVLSKKIKKIADIPIVLIGNNISELLKIAEEDNEKVLSKILTWNGDGKIILAIIQLFEGTYFTTGSAVCKTI